MNITNYLQMVRNRMIIVSIGNEINGISIYQQEVVSDFLNKNIISSSFLPITSFVNSKNRNVKKL